MIIHIDGIDRTGKDTLRRKLHDKHFIFVRSYFSHIVYSRLYNRKIDEKFYFDLINKRISEGEVFVILQVNKEEFSKRCILTNEEHVKPEDYDKHNTAFSDVLDFFRLNYNKNIIIIDTSTASKTDVYEQLQKKLEEITKKSLIEKIPQTLKNEFLDQQLNLFNKILRKLEKNNKKPLKERASQMSKKDFLVQQYNLFEKLSKENFNLTDTEIKEFLEEVELEFSNEPDKSKFFKKWYENFSYDLYSDKYYLFAGWLSFKKWSCNHIKQISSLELDVETIIDFGCGIGFSTKLLQEVFDAKVIGTNIPGTLQVEMCNLLGLTIETDYSKLQHCDLAFCSEYFEHFKEPIDHCDLIIKQCSPKYFVIANSFGTNAVGHFNSYYADGAEYSKKQISRLFNRFLREKGYVQQKTKFWNNRPSIWKKI